VALEGCLEAQGYLISRPMPAPEVFGFLGIQAQEDAGRPVARPSPPQRKAMASEPARLPARVEPMPIIRRHGRTVVAIAPLLMGMRSPAQ
jgi:hypothetical protein